MDVVDLKGPLQKRLESFMALTAEDNFLLDYALDKVKTTVRNIANIKDIPTGLSFVIVEKATAEVLVFKKGTGSLDVESIDLDGLTASIQEGDVKYESSYGKGALTPEQRLDTLINKLLSYGDNEILKFRRLVW